jgi:cell wall-associated NlpC family hydrolase
MRFIRRIGSETYLAAIYALVVLSLTAVMAYPVATAFNRVLAVSLGVVLIGCTGWLVRRSLIALGTLSICLIAAAALVLAPGRPLDAGRLRDAYRVELLRYQGCRYVWGGENRLGVDCSGLVRIALVNAMLRQGICTANPNLVRSGLSLWWHDQSAQSLRDGGEGTVVPVVAADSVNAVDYSHLQVGDLAVTASGVHVMAYAGGRLWVEADPIQHRVIAVDAPAPNDPWFRTKVRVMRWTALQ